jgi:hypothetical protein
MEQPLRKGARDMSHPIATITVMVLVGGVACAAKGTRPDEMSAAHHEMTAQREEEQAAVHAQKAQSACPGYESEAACFRYWTSFQNPTKEQFEQARKHRELAAKHRAASRALVDAEARACQGVPEEERDVSPFFHREDIVAVEKTTVEVKGDLLTGARVIFRPLPGMTADWLQHVVDCHVARNAELGYDHVHLAYCPLALKGVTAIVHPVLRGLAVDIRPVNAKASREVNRRAEALMRVQGSEPPTKP